MELPAQSSTREAMRAGNRIAGLRFHPPPSPSLLPSQRRLVLTKSYSATSPEDCLLQRKTNLEFLPWLQQKAGQGISSVLSVGSSIYGRSLFATRFIHAGECILKIPYSAHITPDDMPSELEPLVSNDIGYISRLAVVLLAERRRGQDSEWAPYISNLPNVDDMNCLMFWRTDELEMIRPSLVYQDALRQRICIENDFLALKPALECFPEMFGDVSLKDFMYAHAVVGSRAWETLKGLSLVPFADFLNHDGNSEAVLVNDEDKEISEVFADRDYAAGEQVLIRYGKFPNSTLLLDFGFTLPKNIHEQVQISMDVPMNDPLHTVKMDLLHRHCMPTIANISMKNSTSVSFTVKKIRSIHGKGRGIPQSLRAFVRVLSAKSLEDLKKMCVEASENDGRLARRPLKSRSREIEAHRILLSQIWCMIQDYNASIEMLGSPSTLSNGVQQPCRRQMANDLLTGELHVLKSACSWLTNYCSN